MDRFFAEQVKRQRALNRYYGVMSNGKLKVRGIEMRRSDTPLLITRMQEEMLSYLAKADDALGFYREIPNALKVLREYSRKVFAGECRIEDMIFTARISTASRITGSQTTIRRR